MITLGDLPGAYYYNVRLGFFFSKSFFRVFARDGPCATSSVIAVVLYFFIFPCTYAHVLSPRLHEPADELYIFKDAPRRARAQLNFIIIIIGTAVAIARNPV